MPPRRTIARVGEDGKLSLSAIQAELARRTKPKAFTAFSYAAFCTSSFDEQRKQDPAVAKCEEHSHAAISHASAQVAVRTQIVSLMTREVGAEAKQLLQKTHEDETNAKAAADAVGKNAEARALLQEGGEAAEGPSGESGATPHVAGAADVEALAVGELAKAWQAAYGRLKRLMELSAKGSLPEGPADGSADSAGRPANLRLTELRRVLSQHAKKKPGRHRQRRPPMAPPPPPPIVNTSASAAGLSFLERWEAVSSAKSPGSGSEASGAARGGEATEANAQASDWLQAWPDATLASAAGAAVAPTNNNVTGPMEDVCRHGHAWDDGAFDDDGYWGGGGGDFYDNPLGKEEEQEEPMEDPDDGDGSREDAAPPRDPPRDPSPIHAASGMAPESAVGLSGATASSADAHAPRPGIANARTTPHPRPPSPGFSTDDDFEAPPRRIANKKAVESSLPGKRRRAVVLAESSDEDGGSPAPEPERPVQGRGLASSQSRTLISSRQRPHATSGSGMDGPTPIGSYNAADGTSGAVPAPSERLGSTAPIAKRLAAPIIVLPPEPVPIAPPPKAPVAASRAAPARKAFKLSTSNYERHLRAADAWSHTAPPPASGLLPLPPAKTAKGRATGGGGGGMEARFVLPPSAVDLKARGAAIFQHMLSEDRCAFEWLDELSTCTWKQSRAAVAAAAVTAGFSEEASFEANAQGSGEDCEFSSAARDERAAEAAEAAADAAAIFSLAEEAGRAAHGALPNGDGIGNSPFTVEGAEMDAAGPPESEDAEPMPPPEDHDYAGGGDLEQLLAARKRKLEERDAMRARVAQEMAVTMDVGIRLNPTLTPRVEPLHNPSDTPLVGDHDVGNDDDKNLDSDDDFDAPEPLENDHIAEEPREGTMDDGFAALVSLETSAVGGGDRPRLQIPTLAHAAHLAPHPLHQPLLEPRVRVPPLSSRATVPQIATWVAAHLHVPCDDDVTASGGVDTNPICFSALFASATATVPRGGTPVSAQRLLLATLWLATTHNTQASSGGSSFDLPSGRQLFMTAVELEAGGDIQLMFADKGGPGQRHSCASV